MKCNVTYLIEGKEVRFTVFCDNRDELVKLVNGSSYYPITNMFISDDQKKSEVNN